MAARVRTLHYINQFFAGIGGEEANDLPVEVREGAVGPGRALDQILGDRGSVVTTIVAGDNHFVEEEGQSVATVKETMREVRPDLVVAGPAFDAGRYGLACALVCRAAGELGIPAVTAMVEDNAGALTHGRDIYVIPTGDSPVETVPILRRVASLGLKMVGGESLGSADVEGYLPRGIRRGVIREKTGAERAVDMVLARVTGDRFKSEIRVRDYDAVDAPPPVANIKDTTIALLTTAGIVPRGNPDGQSERLPRKWMSYDIENVNALTTDGWESLHSGFKGAIYNTVNPNYALPLPALRDIEAQSGIRGLHNDFFSVVGGGCPVSQAKRMGREIAVELKSKNVQAVMLEST